MSPIAHTARPHHAKHKHDDAFTLIELSIVLVIIGLIVGGVLVGQELIKQATMRAQITQIEQFKTAVTTFRGKYNCIPGDCANATTFFPADPSCGSSGVRPYMASSNGLTCNGNGDGVVGLVNYDVENSLFWQHLALAGLIPGSYTGACGYAGANCTTNGYSWRMGVDIPAAVMGQNAMLMIGDPDAEVAGWWSPPYLTPQGGQQVFWLGGPDSTDGSGNAIWLNVPGVGMVLTRNQLSALDRKYDDGLPTSGYITAGTAGCGNVAARNMCYDGSQTPPAYYTSPVANCGVSSLDVAACDAMFKAGF